MLLIMEEPGQRAGRTEDEGRALYQRMLDYSAKLRARGVLRASQSLKTDTEGVRVQVRSGKHKLLDGPFSESKEMVGGYFLLDGVTREEAVAIASEVPRRRMGHGRSAGVRSLLRMTVVADAAIHRTIEAVWRMESAKIIAGLARFAARRRAWPKNSRRMRSWPRWSSGRRRACPTIRGRG